MTDIFVLGFDPVFLDVVVTPLDSQDNKLPDFPPIGEHVANTTVNMIPGGNSLNVARILTRLTSQVFFFGSFNHFFLELMKQNIPQLHCFSTKQKEPNVTVALQFQSGEIQMNAVKYDFNVSDITFSSLFYLCYSSIIPFSNIGLNTSGPALFDFLGNFFIDLNKHVQNISNIDDINHFNDQISSFLLKQNLFTNVSIDKTFLSDSVFNQRPFDLSQKIFYFDPSSLQNFSNWSWLQSFFVEKFAFLPGYKIISVNEHEFALLKDHGVDFEFLIKKENLFLIIHESQVVTIISQSFANKELVKVPELDKKKIISSVGAGDAFNAGLLLKFSKSHDIVAACTNGIKIAQQSLTNTW